MNLERTIPSPNFRYWRLQTTLNTHLNITDKVDTALHGISAEGVFVPVLSFIRSFGSCQRP